jgi:hypothetical protein
MYLCVRGIKSGQQISLTQIHDISLSWLDTPNTQIHDISLSWLDTPSTKIHDISRCHVFFCYGVSVPSQDSERSCFCVLGYLLQVWTVRCHLFTPNTQIHDISLSWLDTPNAQIDDIRPSRLGTDTLRHKYMPSHCPDLVQIHHNRQIHLCVRGIKSGQWDVMYLSVMVYLYQVRTVRWHVFVS